VTVNSLAADVGVHEKACYTSERDAILSAAKRVFDEMGVAGATLEQIALEAGLTGHVVARHFASKRDLITVYVERWAVTRRAEAEAYRAAHADDPRAVLMGCAGLLDHPHGTVPGRSWVHFAAEMVAGHPVRDMVVELRRWYTEFLATELRKLGHTDPDGTAAALLMFHTGAMTAGGLEGVTTATAESARRLYAVLVDDVR
jgi:AcrR family transcriptional regulator